MWILLTIVVFLFARWVSQKVNSPFCNPLLISIGIIIPILLFFKVPFEKSTFLASHACCVVATQMCRNYTRLNPKFVRHAQNKGQVLAKHNLELSNRASGSDAEKKSPKSWFQFEFECSDVIMNSLPAMLSLSSEKRPSSQVRPTTVYFCSSGGAGPESYRFSLRGGPRRSRCLPDPT